MNFSMTRFYFGGGFPSKYFFLDHKLWLFWLRLWTLLLYLPYAFYMASFTYANGDEPGLLNPRGFGGLQGGGYSSQYPEQIGGQKKTPKNTRFVVQNKVIYLEIFFYSPQKNTKSVFSCGKRLK